MTHPFRMLEGVDHFLANQITDECTSAFTSYLMDGGA
jgi:hypothetical protein